MKRLILLFCIVIMLIGISEKYKEDYYIIPNESIRIRIIPNSNSIEDQFLKKEVKNTLELEIENDLKQSKTIESSRKILKNNIDKYRQSLKRILEEKNTKIDYSIDYGKHYFPEKTYKKVKYKKGYYESLLITLGKGEGSNWWCILFPPICAVETKEKLNEIEYTSYVKELFEKYLK